MPGRETGVDLDSFWAKLDPVQSVVTHAVISGMVGQMLYDAFLSEGVRARLSADLCLSDASAREFLGYLISLHDIGKLEYSFQAKSPAMRERLEETIAPDELMPHGVRHEKTGEKSIRSIWEAADQDRHSARIFSKIVGSHHQGKGGKARFGKDSVWYGFQRELEERMRQRFVDGPLTLPCFDRVRQGPVSAILLGLMIMADWISSGVRFADAEQWIGSAGTASLIQTKAEDFLRRSALAPDRVSWADDFCGVWPNIPASGLRPLQAAVERLFRDGKAEYEVLLIEAPMGEGKTEAGMYAALQMARSAEKDGFYVALPTAATSNQMVLRMRELLELHGLSGRIRLLHSMAWLSDAEEIDSPDETDEVARWLAPARRALLGQYAVGTVDQAMLAATNVRYGVLRLLGLSNKVLLIDEIHSYDAYMSEILIHLLEWCRALEIPVVMLSATLPPAAKAKLLAPYTNERLSDGYPLLTAVRTDGAVTERIVEKTDHALTVSVQLHPLLGDPAGIAALAADRVREGGCLCVLMNTVREAQEVYRALRTIYDGELLLFHAQFPAGQRDEIEKRCLRLYGKEKRGRPKRSILVCSQVVEQSLDVDFDAMITAVAPIDLVIQRMGRVFRHGDSPRPKTMSAPSQWILIPQEQEGFGPSAFVYPECLLRRTVDLLSGVSRVRIPEDIAGLVRDGYDPARVPEDELKEWMEAQVREQVQAAASQQYLLLPPDKLFSPLGGVIQYEDDEEMGYLSAKTRLGEPTVRIALLEQDEIRRLEPFLDRKDGERRVRIRNRTLAEMVMKKSVSVRTSRLGDPGEAPEHIRGDGLLSGVRIYPARGSVCRLENGKVIRFDEELGLLIEDGEK